MIATAQYDTLLTLSHRSPGVTAMYNELRVSAENHVLDLGLSSGASFNFFTQLSCKIHFENINEFFADNDTDTLSGDELIAKLDDYLTPLDPDMRFDAILTWDLFNFLDLKTIGWLIQRLSQYCQPNTLLHIMKCVSANMPAKPRHCQIIDQYRINIKQSSQQTARIRPYHGTALLLRHMPNFYMENSYLNFEGMVPGLGEQLMRFQPEKKQVVRRQASDELAQGANYISRKRNADGQTHKSYALPILLNKFNASNCANVLDLGLKNRNNYDFLYSQTKGVFAENIFQEIQVQIKSGQTPELKNHMLNFPEGTKFDVILVWDILNFLPTEFLTAVFNKLAPFTHEATLLHTILYSGKETPSQPQQFQIVDADNIEIYPSDKQPGFSPLTSTRLLKTIGNFKLSDTFVFRPGMQRGIYEYLFQRHTQR